MKMLKEIGLLNACSKSIFLIQFWNQLFISLFKLRFQIRQLLRNLK